MSNKLGEAVKRERKFHAMTLRQVARQSGVSTSYVSEIERGTRTPTPARMFQICNLFPDADSAEWLWLLLSDHWGEPVADVMRRYAVATSAQTRPDRPQEARTASEGREVTTDSGEAE